MSHLHTDVTQHTDLTQHTGAVRHTPISRVEAVGAQVRRHHLLHQSLQPQVVFTVPPSLMNPLQTDRQELDMKQIK